MGTRVSPAGIVTGGPALRRLASEEDNVTSSGVDRAGVTDNWPVSVPPSMTVSPRVRVSTGVCVMVMVNSCVASGAVPFEALSVPLKVPTSLGVPEISPALFMVRPVGSLPAVTA